MQHLFKHQNHGFTLIELIIALSMLSILTAYAIPNYRNFKLNQTMTAEVNRLVATINHARSQSIINREHIIVCATTSYVSCDASSQWHRGWMVFIDRNKDRALDAEDELMVTENSMAQGLEAKASIHRQKIRFDATGYAPGTNLSIRFCDERGAEHGKAVIISNVGRPRLAQQITSCG